MISKWGMALGALGLSQELLFALSDICVCCCGTQGAHKSGSDGENRRLPPDGLRAGSVGCLCPAGTTWQHAHGGDARRVHAQACMQVFVAPKPEDADVKRVWMKQGWNKAPGQLLDETRHLRCEIKVSCFVWEVTQCKRKNGSKKDWPTNFDSNDESTMQRLVCFLSATCLSQQCQKL